MCILAPPRVSAGRRLVRVTARSPQTTRTDASRTEDARVGRPHFATKDTRHYTTLVSIFASLLLISNIAATQPVFFDIPLPGFAGGPASFPLFLDGGFLLFPLAYVLGDVLSEVYGFRATRRAVFTSFAIAAGAVVYFQFVIAMPKTPDWDASPFVGLLGGAVVQIFAASFLGFLTGQTLNSWVLVRIKRRTDERSLWARLMGSTLVGETADTIVFCLIAAPVIGLTEPMDVLNYIVVGVVWKCLVEAVMLPVTYRVVALVKRHEPAYAERPEHA